MPVILPWLIGLLIYIASVSGGYFIGRADGRKLERGIQDAVRVQMLGEQKASFEGKVNEQARIAENARQQAERNAADRDSASAAADGLRRARDVAVAAARKCSAAPGSGTNANDPAGVLGRVLEESIERNKALARYADDVRTASESCVGSYQALERKKP